MLLTLATMSAVGCNNDLGSTEEGGGFDREVVAMCSSTTTAVGVRTDGGGRLAIELHRPGCSTTGCEGSDVYASGSWATIRIAGPDLLLEGCDPVTAVGADRLRVTFTKPAESEVESYEIGLVGDCLVGLGCATPDGG